MDGEGFPAPTVRRSGGQAVLLSLLFPGLGHQYVGEGRLAARILFAVGIGWSAVLALAVVLDREPLLSLAFSVAIGLSAQVGLAIDAYRRAKPHRASFELRPCNSTRGYLIYFGLWVAFVAVPYELRRAYVVESFKTPSGSNEPTLQVGDHFVVTKLGARDRNPQRGDLVIFDYPADPRHKFVKRLIGLPGETVQIREGVVWVDGVALVREEVPPPPDAKVEPRIRYFREHTPEGASYVVKNMSFDHFAEDDPADDPSREPTQWRVPEGHVFVMGDNRNQSHDSTSFGPVPRANLDGRARAIWLPFERAGNLR